MGSSPLTRGKPQAPPRYARSERLIPAHAGKTSQAGIAAALLEAHPRSRGENPPAVGGVCLAAGSSPLTRGKRGDLLLELLRVRLIPAHAGKTPRERCRTRPSPAHPRSRGENISPSAFFSARTGSSPLTRGKLKTGKKTAAELRLIPAHAGKTQSRDASVRGVWAHPRSRGENK